MIKCFSQTLALEIILSQSTKGSNLINCDSSGCHGLLESYFELASCWRNDPNQSPDPIFEGLAPKTPFLVVISLSIPLLVQSGNQNHANYFNRTKHKNCYPDTQEMKRQKEGTKYQRSGNSRKQLSLLEQGTEERESLQLRTLEEGPSCSWDSDLRGGGVGIDILWRDPKRQKTVNWKTGKTGTNC